MNIRFLSILLVMVLGAGASCAVAESTAVELPPGVQIPRAAQPGPGFDVEKATQAYLALLSSAQRAKSDAYFEGGYWVSLWQALYTTATCILLISLGWATGIRRWVTARMSRRWLQSALTVALLWLVLSLFGMPMDWYTGFFREHQYNMSNQTFGGWLHDWIIAVAVNLVLVTIMVTAVYIFVRRAKEYWVLRATAFTFVALLILFMVSPVFIAPLFNDYKPLPPGETRDAILSLARANNIPTTNVMWFDQSRQTKRISANVSGLFGTTRVSLNDNLLNKTSLPEIKAVMGHEMGHYVLNHSFKGTMQFTLLFGAMFLILNWLFEGPLRSYRARHGIADRADPAGFPLAFAALTILGLLGSPLLNRVTYVAEAEADMFGLNAAREPHGFATSAIRLGAYRKLEPGPIEEFLLYDHPSGYERVHRSMLWLEENQDTAAVR